MSEAEVYARWVLAQDNESKTGRLMKLAAKRFLSDLLREDIHFDEVEANRMIIFCERYCKQWEGDWRGVPLKFEPWQKFIFQQVYGWIKKSNGRRRITKLYVQIAKKNGKSTMSAGLALFHLFADPRINTPKIFTAANNEDQAKICVNMAGRIIEQSEELCELVDAGKVRLRTYGINITDIIHDEKDGFIKALSKESDDKKSKQAGGKHGINASCGIVDEFGMSPDHGASKTIATSMAARTERLMAYITTAGFNKDGPCFRELRKVGIDVLEGSTVSDEYLPIIFELDQEDDYKDPVNWTKCNPNIDISVSREFLLEQVNDAVRLGGSTEVDVKTLNFNLWVDSPEVFIPSEVWNKNSHGITEEDLLGAECYGGIEIVSGKLLNCFCFLFPNVKGKTVIKPIFWMPDANRKNKETDNYNKWVDDKLIHTFLGDVADNDKVYELIMDGIGLYNMHSFAYKTNLENNDIVQSLIKNGIQGNPISHGYQGISTPTLTWEEMLTSNSIEHFNNPVLGWQNSNCMAVRKDNDIRLEKSGGRVGGIYATINALAQWKTIEAEGKSDDAVIEIW
jgi:phage terminase large subunit-like protein